MFYEASVLNMNMTFFFQEIYKDANTQVHTLRKMVKEKEEAIQRQSTLEKKIHELEKQGTIKIQKKGDGDIAILPVVASGTLPMGSDLAGGNYVGPVPGAASSGPSVPPPPPLPPSSDTPEAGKMPGGRGGAPQCFISTFPFLKKGAILRSWRNGLVVKSIYRSSRHLSISQHS